MTTNSPLPQERKLSVLFRVEPGCLGPDGKDHVIQFCSFAQNEVTAIDTDFIHWEIVPRFDKALPEMQYTIANKRLSHDKAATYLALFEKSLDEFEEHLHEKLAQLINQYLGR
jgi:hypothetical protein